MKSVTNSTETHVVIHNNIYESHKDIPSSHWLCHRANCRRRTTNAVVTVTVMLLLCCVLYMLGKTSCTDWRWSENVPEPGASLLGRRLLPRVRQHSALSVVRWRSDLRGAANTRQLQQQNLYSRGTSLVELSSGPAVQSRHQLWTV